MDRKIMCQQGVFTYIYMLQNEQKKIYYNILQIFSVSYDPAKQTRHKRIMTGFSLIHQKKMINVTRTALLFLCTNAHWAAINVTSIHIINKLAASLCAFPQERSVHNCSITGKSTH